VGRGFRKPGITGLLVVIVLIILTVAAIASGCTQRIVRTTDNFKTSGSTAEAAGNSVDLDSIKISQESDTKAKFQGLETPMKARGTDSVSKSKPGTTIVFNTRTLVNNNWGAPPEEKLTSGIYLAQNNNFGWFWDRLAPREKAGIKGMLPIYPSIRIGGNPWEPSKCVHFPVRLSEVKSLNLELSYTYPTTPDGAYDLAYDMFLLDTNQPSSNPKRNAEVMIWIHQTLAPPSGCYKGDFTDGNNNYELYSYVMADGRLYFAFIMKGQPVFQAQHTVDAKKLLDLLNLDPDWYIPGIELGNEVIDGAGKIEISQLIVSLNGANL
jgi:hypothetical protein